MMFNSQCCIFIKHNSFEIESSGGNGSWASDICSNVKKPDLSVWSENSLMAFYEIFVWLKDRNIPIAMEV